MGNDKLILDVCCGSKMMWFNKSHPNALYLDKREYEKGHNPHRINRELKPDMVMDFRKLDFPDESFKLVVMDPPHIIHKEDSKMNMVITYGALNKETWKEDIKKGFDEAWRVLEEYGILIFKWNETSIKKKEVLKVLNKEPLFGHPNGSSVPTHWLCFMKIK